MKLLRSRNYESVYAQSVEALRKDEKNPLPFFLIGIVAMDTGDHTKALELLSKASNLDPQNVHYQTYHAKAHTTLGQHELAKKRADMAAALGTKEALLADMIGIVYSRTGYHELAIPFFEQATQRNPRWAKFHFNLGASAEFIGDFDKAKTAYANTLSIDPKFYLAWFSLTALEKQTPDNNNLDTLIALFSDVGDDAEARLLLGHSIAKTLEDLGRYEESLDWLATGKAAKKAQVSFDQKDMADIFKAAKLTPQKLDKSSAPAHTGALPTTPIFVVGLPRTGTTLVDRILSSHPDVRSAGELNLFAQLTKIASGLPPSVELDAETFRAANKIDMTNTGQNYRRETQDLAQGAAYLIDKMPLNFFYAGLIQRALPEAKIIVLRRGPMDSCVSNYRQLFATHNRNYDYTYDLEDTASFYCEFDDLITHWRDSLPSDCFMEVAYEDIVFDQENQTRELLAFCGLSWDEACLRFHENDAPVSTASAVQVRQLLYSGSIDRWKKYGDKLDGLKAALGRLAG
jgi:tetratricopeptide (TPR) repeat protein